MIEKPNPSPGREGLGNDKDDTKHRPYSPPTQPSKCLAIHAELTGSESCAACGISANGTSPILGLCRKLIAAGHDPAQPLHAYRDGTLALVVHSLGEAAELEIASGGTGFIKPARAVRIASPMRSLPLCRGAA